MKINEAISSVDHGEGQSVSVVGDTYTILISGKETDGNHAVIDMHVPPGGGPGPHSHTEMQEIFYIVEGEIEFKMQGEKYVARKGSLVNIPFGGKVHAFKNTTNKVAHLLCTVVPAGLEAFFREIGKPVATGTFLPPPDLGPDALNKLKSTA